MRKILTKAISFICVLVLLAAFTPSALAYEETTVINWADKNIYSGVTGSFPTGNASGSVGYLSDTNVHSLFGVGDSTTKGSGYNVILNNPDAESGTTNTARSKFTINLGAERSIDYIDLYQYKNRITVIKVYKMTAAQYTQANNGVSYLSDNFVNGTILIGEATFDHGTNADLTLNQVDACNTPDRIELDGAHNAQYLLFVVTEVVPSANTKYQIQKITVNKKGTIGVNVTKNWADKNVYSDVTGVFPTGRIDATTGNQTGTGNLPVGDVSSVFGVGDSSTKNSGYNIILNNPVAQTGTTNTARSKFEIDLGAERPIDYIDLYQYKNRIAEIKVYKMTAAQYTQANNGVCYLSDNFVNGTTLIGEATFDHGTNADLTLNQVDACNTPDRIELNGTQNAQYLLFVVTEVVPSANTKYQIQKITVNGNDNTWGNALELDVNLFQNSGSTKNIGVFAAQKNGNMMVKCDVIRTDVARLTQVELFAQKLAIDPDATSIDFIILDMTTLEPLFKVPYTIEKN